MGKEKISIVIDTNTFINPDSRKFFGKTPQEAFATFLDIASKNEHIHCFMPPSVHEELAKFIGTIPVTKKTILIKKKPPAKYQMTIPSLMFYELIEEIRNRINKGLRVGEKHIRKALHEADEQDIIKNFREEYRVALREGVIDSKEDCDLLLLAKELNAYLVTSDNGLITWAQKLGIHCINAQELKVFFKEHR